MHEFLRQLLQTDVDTEVQVLTGYRQLVILAVVVGTLNASPVVAHKDLNALLAAKQFLVAPLDAVASGIVTRLVIAIVIQVALVHLAHATQQMGCQVIAIVTQRTLTDTHAREME